MEHLNHNLIVANVIGVITFILSCYVNSFINRRKFLIGWAIINFIDSISYVLLNAYIAVISVVYWGVKNIIIVLMHKEEKIVQSKLEGILFAFPFLIFGILLFKTEGPMALFGGILNFLNNLLFIIKKDKHRILADATMDIGYMSYDFVVGNYVSGIKYIIEIATFMFSYFRVTKNGEHTYYKDQTNIID